MDVALVGLVDRRGWLLLQERDEHAPVDPDRWSLVGGGVEAGESHAEAARRELEEETTLTSTAGRGAGSSSSPRTRSPASTSPTRRGRCTRSSSRHTPEPFRTVGTAV